CTEYPDAAAEAGHDSATCASPATAASEAGGARFTSSVVEASCDSVPEVPVIVSESAYGLVVEVVFMVKVEVPEPAIEAGLNPPLVIPLGKPDSLPTERLTFPVNPLCGDTVTVNVALRPGVTVTAGWLTAISKSPAFGSTSTIRIGGDGSEFPAESITVSEAV